MKLFGKRGRTAEHAESAYAAVQWQARTPASSTPLADALAADGPGVTDEYVVLPRSVAEQMSLPWQQQAARVLTEFYQANAHLSWPSYRVIPSREELLVDLDEDQLAEAGYVVELDADGSLVYRERSGRPVEDPETTKVLVTCLDPVVAAGKQAMAGSPYAPAPSAAAGPQPPAAPIPAQPGPAHAAETSHSFEQFSPVQHADVELPPAQRSPAEPVTAPRQVPTQQPPPRPTVPFNPPPPESFAPVRPPDVDDAN